MKTSQKTTELQALEPYLAAVRGRQPLTREAEHDLAVRARRGDAGAREALVRQHLELVVYVARQQKRGTLRLEELVQEGNLGLLRAVEKFDPAAGTRFSTYAVWWIRAYIWKYLKGARSAVRPRSGTVAGNDFSLDSAIDEQGDVSFLDRVEDEGPGPDDSYAVTERNERLRLSLQKVRRRVGDLGWDIIQTRLQQDPPDTLSDIGKRWGVSRERVRQVEVGLKRFLRHYLEPVRDEPGGEGPTREAA